MSHHDNRRFAFPGITSWHGGAIDLLLMRMESREVDASEVNRIAPDTFRELADTCMACECKEGCERDLAYDLAGMDTQDWQDYCPNAAALKAMSDLPWFRYDQGRSQGSVRA